MHTVHWESPIFVLFPCRHAHQQFDSLVNMRNRVDVERAALYSLHNLIFQHQLPHIRHWNDNALFPCQPAFPAEVKKALYLIGHAADGLYFALLVNRTCNSQILPDGQFRQGGKDAVKLRTGRTVSVDAIIILLKADPARE